MARSKGACPIIHDYLRFNGKGYEALGVHGKWQSERSLAMQLRIGQDDSRSHVLAYELIKKGNISEGDYEKRHFDNHV